MAQLVVVGATALDNRPESHAQTRIGLGGRNDTGMERRDETIRLCHEWAWPTGERGQVGRRGSDIYRERRHDHQGVECCRCASLPAAAMSKADVTQGRLVRTLAKHAHRVETLSLSTDFTTRTGPFDHGQARVTKKKFASDTEAREAALARYQAATKTVPEALVSGSHDHTLMLWPPQHGPAAETTAPGTPVARLVGHQQQINQVMFSPDGRFIASASFDKSVRIWNGRTGAFVTTLIGHVGPVYMLAWSRDSRYLASCSKDTTVKVSPVARTVC